MNGRSLQWMAFGCLTVGCGLAVAQQRSTERPDSRVEASPAGLLMRLPAGKADADGLVMAPAEGEYDVVVGSMVEIECATPVEGVSAAAPAHAKVVIHNESPDVLALPADGFRRLTVLRINEEGKSAPLTEKSPARAVAYLKAVKEGDGQVVLTIGGEEFTYKFRVTTPSADR